MCILIWSLSPARHDLTDATCCFSAFIRQCVRSVPPILLVEVKVRLVLLQYGPVIDVPILCDGRIDLRIVWHMLRTMPEMYEFQNAWEQLRLAGHRVLRSTLDVCMLDEFIIGSILIIGRDFPSLLFFCNSLCAWLGDFVQWVGDCGWFSRDCVDPRPNQIQFPSDVRLTSSVVEWLAGYLHNRQVSL